MANSKITLENLFNLLNSVPSADKDSVIEVAYSAVKSKLDELVQNYNQIYSFYQQLTSFSILTGEEFKIFVPDVVDYNIVSHEIQNSVSEKALGNSDSVNKTDSDATEQNAPSNDPIDDSHKDKVSENDKPSTEQAPNDDETSLDNEVELSHNNDVKDELPEDFGAFADDELPETTDTSKTEAPEDDTNIEHIQDDSMADNDPELELIISKVNKAAVSNETKELLNLLIEKVLKISEKKRIA